MLCRWNELSNFMRTDAVRPYYEALKRRQLSLLIKRTFDFIMSSVLLVLLAPVFLFLAIWIKTDSAGPIFYRQERITQYGRVFRIYKFRTMIQNADQLGGLVTVSGDSRITEVGKKIRKYRLDEIPQLINIWRGEMTFVGTRPEVPKYVKRYTEEMRATLLLPAGLTSKASILFKDEEQMLKGTGTKALDQTYVENVLPLKMRWNLEMLERFTIREELYILVQTFAVMFKSN